MTRSVSHRVRLWVGILALAGCGRTPPADDAGKAADAFLETVRTGKVDAAWESTTAEFKSSEGRESFRRVVTKEAVLKKPLKRSSQEPVTIGQLERLELMYQPEDTSLKSSVKLLLAADGGEWKVDSLSVEKR